MNPLTEEELQELASLVPELSIEWSEGDPPGTLWVGRRDREMLDTHPALLRAWDLIGPQVSKLCAPQWAPRYRTPRPGVIPLLTLLDAIHPTLGSPRFPD